MNSTTYEAQRLAAKRHWARTASLSALYYALGDCISCINAGVNVPRYTDEAALYREEIARRPRGVSRTRRPA